MQGLLQSIRLAVIWRYAGATRTNDQHARAFTYENSFVHDLGVSIRTARQDPRGSPLKVSQRHFVVGFYVNVVLI
eukprot:SAG31_NODE_311_length_17866_cov_7.010750_11_plen_75_part_00